MAYIVIIIASPETVLVRPVGIFPKFDCTKIILMEQAIFVRGSIKFWQICSAARAFCFCSGSASDFFLFFSVQNAFPSLILPQLSGNVIYKQALYSSVRSFAWFDFAKELIRVASKQWLCNVYLFRFFLSEISIFIRILYFLFCWNSYLFLQGPNLKLFAKKYMKNTSCNLLKASRHVTIFMWHVLPKGLRLQ